MDGGGIGCYELGGVTGAGDPLEVSGRMRWGGPAGLVSETGVVGGWHARRRWLRRAVGGVGSGARVGARAMEGG